MPFETYTGEFASKQILVTVGGQDEVHGSDNVGTQAATLMTWLTIDSFQPDLIINAGTAGGMAEKGCETGDVYLSESPFVFMTVAFRYPCLENTASVPFHLWTQQRSPLHWVLKGRISTGDSLDMTETDLEQIRANGSIIKEMEAAAIAWVCRLTNTPMFAIKAITDLIDDDTVPRNNSWPT